MSAQDLRGEVTAWLASTQADTAPPAAATTHTLFERLYADLRRQAASQLRHEAPGHTLSASALAHEAWFRLAAQERTPWQSRSHFLAVAAVMMRRILLNHAAARRAAKRDAVKVSLTLPEALAVSDGPAAEVQAVHEALLALEAVDARAAQVVEMKFFGGLENEEVASALGVSLATVKRDWALARAWLHRALSA
ncbi:ECF-type sigma factor [Ideonella livida]|uniref:Sigma-70 family RNA polymerase sigma factor n=1 Tax=Ideonella livida TaxID=2707176 RepID=A0A7C9THZ6_9BURK|nr:ECF-type sigma factor [Ideonella livida]NDY90979.1 sigma-70 family RNA polymerase sigma factor [Ideonella livida]